MQAASGGVFRNCTAPLRRQGAGGGDGLGQGAPVLASSPAVCSYSLPELEPRCFPSTPDGRCPKCDGSARSAFSTQRIAAFPSEPGFRCSQGLDKRNQFFYQMLQSLALHYGFDLETPSNSSGNHPAHPPLRQRQGIAQLQVSGEKGGMQRAAIVRGYHPNFERRYRETESATVREELAKYINYCLCRLRGHRLRAEARHVLVGGKALFEIGRLPLKQTYDFFATLEFDVRNRLSRAHHQGNRGTDPLPQQRRAGLLSLDRSANTCPAARHSASVWRARSAPD